jgi:diguanylate cyclase (GGDEF)-like protein
VERLSIESLRRALTAQHPDPDTRVRATNALLVLTGVLVVGLLATVPLLLVPAGGVVAGLTCLTVSLVALVSLALVRRGHVDPGLWLFFAVVLLGNLAGAAIEDDARLSAVYLVIPVAIAGVTMAWRGLAIVTALSLLIGVTVTVLFPPVDPVGTQEIVTAGVICITAVLTTSLLGGWGQRREARRADAAARHNAELAETLRVANQELEARVADRTEELQLALARQETLVAELAELSVRDPITGLHNRRHADEQLPRLAAAAERYAHPLALAMADLDHFKRVNDEHSYAVGDEVLRRFARILEDSARGSDVVARYGGEEFVIVMPQTTLEHALVVCERIRRSVESHPWHELAPGLRVTVSLGVTDSEQGGGMAALVRSADGALHAAKRAGRNQVATLARLVPDQTRVAGAAHDAERSGTPVD